MAEDDYGEFEKEKPAEQVKQTTEEVKNTVKEDAENKGKSVRDKAKDAFGKGQEKLHPVISTAKEKVEKLDGKRPEVQEEAKEMLNQAKHTVGKVVQQESKDVVEGVKRLAKDEQAFREAAHKVVDKVSGGSSSGNNQQGSTSDQNQNQQQQQAHQIPDFSDFSELEEDWDDEGEKHSKQHLLEHHNHEDYVHQQPQEQHKRKKSPLGYFKMGAKYSGKNNEKPNQEEKKGGDSGENHGVLGTVKSVFGQSQGDKAISSASNLAQKKLAQMRHVVDAQMDEVGNATAAEKKTQGVGLVQSFVCLCTCASSVHVTG